MIPVSNYLVSCEPHFGCFHLLGMCFSCRHTLAVRQLLQCNCSLVQIKCLSGARLAFLPLPRQGHVCAFVYLHGCAWLFAFILTPCT